jgi:hypothetical protein
MANDMIIYSLLVQDSEIFYWAKHMYKFLMNAVFKRQLSIIREYWEVS